MINIQEELSNFKNIDVESVEQKIGSIPEDIKNAIELYNRALDDIRNRNEDIAIISLKKAIAIYPAFYEAMNLMGVCLASLEEEDEARVMFNKVIKMDDNSIRAAKYLEKLDGRVSADEGRTKTSKQRFKRKESSPLKPFSNKSILPEKSKPDFIKYLLGFLLGIFVMCILWLIIPSNAPVVINLRGNVNESAQIKSLQEYADQLETRLNEAQNALEKAKETEKFLQDQLVQYSKWSAILRELQKLADEGKYRDVVIEIEKNLVGLDLPEDLKTEINELNNFCKPKAVKQFYDTARQIYQSNAKNKDPEVYRQAADEYRMAMRIIEELEQKPAYTIEIYYYGGKAIALSQSPGKHEAESEAIQCFETVVELSPNSKMAGYARARINEIEAGQTINH
jgi:tetratricopeptide (TPR) repeat protein